MRRLRARVGSSVLGGLFAALAAWGVAWSTEPAAAGGPTRTAVQGPAKPSSYAPQPRAHSRAYGGPIQRPILSKHQRPKKRTERSPPTKKPAPAGAG